ncbi:sterol desaturase family protein [Roseobacter sp. MH60115]|uniref:sterol desaturase family protein n=1 Tax=Roseobacter sp. MH60115 TaxID=2785324 RepID=UPI0018A27979|nr:sterol desaturase family protein [Roseobacter sp. MH60115]
MDLGNDFVNGVLAHAYSTVTAPLDPANRIFALYILTSLVFAFCIYLAARKRNEETEGTFLKFLFPKKVWDHPSAWLDLRYFFFHNMIGHFMMVGLAAWMSTLTFGWITGGQSLLDLSRENTLSTMSNIGLAFLFMIIATLVIDFIAFLTHYVQHKSPLLWQFHKVHHSAEVMHPISNFREHPIDNLFYSLTFGVGYGATIAGAMILFGFVPNVPSLLGVPLLGFLFNLAGYNLRHSHIWLRWPGKLSMIFPSPAHHHVHHSCHPDHIDKNFAFIFPIWDVIFKTYHMPEDNRDVKFGIGEEDTGEMTTCLRLYTIPFRDAFRLVRRMFGRRGAGEVEQPVSSVTPAE